MIIEAVLYLIILSHKHTDLDDGEPTGSIENVGSHKFMQCGGKREKYVFLYFIFPIPLYVLGFYIFLRTEIEEMLFRISHGSLPWI